MLYGIKKDCPIKTAFFIYLIITIPNIPFTNMKYGMFGFEIFWRRTRDSNPRAGFPTYSLSRGAPSPLGYFSKMVKYIKSGIINLAERKRFELLVPCGITSFQD